jgi:hypothetical protein
MTPCWVRNNDAHEPVPQLSYTSTSTLGLDTVFTEPSSNYVDLERLIADGSSCTEQVSKAVDLGQMAPFRANEYDGTITRQEEHGITQVTGV